MTDFLILFLVGAVASAINAVAGGGSLISFPSLHLGFHLSEKVANMTNTVSLWPGSLAGAIGFLNVLKPLGRYFRLFILPTLLGAALGAWMLIQTKDALFRSVVPWLLFLAAALLLFQLKIKEFDSLRGRIMQSTQKPCFFRNFQTTRQQLTTHARIVQHRRHRSGIGSAPTSGTGSAVIR